jgi:two-component system cell cycle sensor histidine kinase/response regulator CckA
MADGLRLFLVEDDENIVYIMRRCLEKAGHQVHSCRTGADALIVLSHERFDLVLLDYWLGSEPEMSGLDLLRAMHAEGIAVPVLMITGEGNERIATEALRAGALDYIVKDKTRVFITDLPKRVVESVTRHRLQQTNSLLIASLESARDGIIVADLHGVLLHVNGALERMLGFDRDELLGQNARMLQSDRHPSLPRFDDIWRTLLERSSWQGDLLARRKDGTLVDTSLSFSPIFDARGQLTHFVGIYRDNSDHRHMQRQLFQAQKMQSVGTLAGGVAHEFNNLLAGIQGYATLSIREPGVPDTVREFLEQIVHLSERAADLTRQLLAFARKPALFRKPTSLARLLRSTSDLVQRSLNIEADVSIAPGDEESAWVALADANQLQQVLVNLCLNARDAMTAAEAKPLKLRLRAADLLGELSAFPQNVPPGRYLIFDIEDRGTGMTPEVLAQCMDPFYTTKEVGQGTGLGLPVAFGIINGHQGHITIDSQADVGTCISLYRPRFEDAQTVADRLDTRVLEPEATPSRHILVVDDEDAVVDVVRRYLEIAGHRVSSVASGQSALDQLPRLQPIDLIILDWMIPREDSRGNLLRLRAAAPTVPILLCTGMVQPAEVSGLAADDTVQIIHKPFRMNELWYAVNRTLSGPPTLLSRSPS